MNPRALAAALLFALPVNAGKPRPVVVHAKAGDSQPALSVGFDSNGALVAQTCAQDPCSLQGAVDLGMPADARELASKASLAVVRIAKARRIVSVEVDDSSRSRTWVILVAAPLDGSGRPKTLFSGWTGLVEGEPGERRGPMVQRGLPNADGTWDVVIGERQEQLDLCGRKTILSPKLVVADLSLRPAKVQRLGSDERDRAQEITAVRLAADAPKASYRLLRATAASSAVGDPGNLTDGKPETTWAENRGAEGRGEFVRMDAPSQLPITGFELSVRPAAATPERGVAPADFWLATHYEIVHVRMPEDAWKFPGARYQVKLERPIRDDCLALVTESAFTNDKDARVTFGELSALTEFDATAVDALVGALAGGGARAEAAADALRALGPVAVEPIAKAFDLLDEGGRRVALAVLDQAACNDSAPTYLKAMTGPFPAHRVHARDRLRRCGEPAANVLEQAFATAPKRLRPLLASELALVAPERAVRIVVPLLPQADTAGRRLLRKALGYATRDGKAAPEVRKLLADPALDAVAGLDLLRALGDRAPGFAPEAPAALARLVGPKADFRTRYLALGPMAALARSDAGAKGMLSRAIVADPSHHVRVEAVRRVPKVADFRSELVKALGDDEVRVREAAVETLQKPEASFAATPVAKLLLSDPWPMVRSASAVALSKYGADAAIDRALADALGDASAKVRAPAVLALGDRRATAHAERVRERVEDKEEAIEVRVNAVLALGLMCDTGSLDLLTDIARRLRDPGAAPEWRALAPVALGALSRMHPPDLRRRLEPLLSEKASSARRAAEAALSAPATCGRRASPRP